MPHVGKHWDIFCAVIDNFGDIGICWRLARQLVAEHGYAVRLWVDDLYSFARLCPEVNPRCVVQQHQGVAIHHWRKEAFIEFQPEAVVIEAFGCTLPDSFIAAMAAQPNPPTWINLEYLSAEDWVADCHGLASLQSSGLKKFFFFPGVQPKTGGVLREPALLDQRNTFKAQPQTQQRFLADLGISVAPNERLISVFAYETPGIKPWLELLQQATQPTHLLIPEGRVLTSFAMALGVDALCPGTHIQQGSLHLWVLPFLTQEDYDRLLWCCSLNIVRGEDSLIRAQWAGVPLIWHIYPQSDQAHWGKLETFFQHYTHSMPPSAATALWQLWRSWNAFEGLEQAWSALEPYEQDWSQGAAVWLDTQSHRPDLASALVKFVTDQF